MKINKILMTLLFLSLCSCNNEAINSDSYSNISDTESSISISDSSEKGFEIMYEKTVNTTYEFIGDEKELPGFAQGLLTITPLENALNLGYYIVYYANEDGLLKEYDELTHIKSTGNTVQVEIKDGTYLPYNATKLVVFESTTPFFDDLPDLSYASDIIDLNINKSLLLSNPYSKFAAVSDVHMNYQDYNRGAYEKWEQALNFFYENDAEYVIVSGDMTGDEDLDNQYQKYVDIINNSPYDFNDVYECIGNHGNKPETISLMNKYTKGSNQIHPYEDSPYYHVLIENENNNDNLFIFMAQELKAPGDTAAYDNFSKAQIDWLEDLLIKYNNPNTNIFLIEHSPFLNYGAGDRHPSGYGGLLKYTSSFPQNKRFKTLMEKYKDVIMLSGHTHLTFYEGENYSDENNKLCRTIHVSSTCQPNSYDDSDTFVRNTDGRYEVTPTYGSEGYIVEIYNEYILFKGYNLTTKRLIPKACLIMPIKAYALNNETSESFYNKVLGDGSFDNPYQISSEEDFYYLTKEFNESIETNEENMFGYNKYFIQTSDIDMTAYPNYSGTYANGNAKCFFAGNYNGNGHILKVNINDSDQRSIFPYTYGVISNLIIKGSITSTNSAQVVRTLYGELINCIFDIDLTSKSANGICYSNYGFIYNVYTKGELVGNSKNPISSNDTSTDYYNVYYYRYDNNGLLILDEYGIKEEDIDIICDAFNNKNHLKYNDAITYLNGIRMCYSYIVNNEIRFQK